MDRDVTDLIAKRKIPVFVVEEDLSERGIERRELIPTHFPVIANVLETAASRTVFFSAASSASSRVRPPTQSHAT